MIRRRLFVAISASVLLIVRSRRSRKVKRVVCTTELLGNSTASAMFVRDLFSRTDSLHAP